MAETNDTIEHWLPVVGYEGLYSVSDRGRVRTEGRQYVDSAGRHRSVRPHIVSQRARGNYLSARLWRSAVGKDFHVHRLVAIAFLPRDGERTEVNHLDGVHTDNRAKNLAWVTPAENVAHAVTMGLYPTGDRNGSRLHPEALRRGDGHPSRLRREALARGEAHGRTHLTDGDVRAIRSRYALGGVTLRELGAEYGMSFSAISRLIRRETWAHLPAEHQ